VASVEGFRNIRRAELDDDLLAAGGRVGGVLETEVGVEAVRRAGLEDLGEDERCEGGGLEEEANEGAVDDWLLYERRFRELCKLF
jgi:hypothetical protein